MKKEKLILSRLAIAFVGIFAKEPLRKRVNLEYVPVAGRKIIRLNQKYRDPSLITFSATEDVLQLLITRNIRGVGSTLTMLKTGETTVRKL